MKLEESQKFSERLTELERFQRAGLRMGAGNGNPRPSHQAHYSQSASSQLQGTPPHLRHTEPPATIGPSAPHPPSPPSLVPLRSHAHIPSHSQLSKALHAAAGRQECSRLVKCSGASWRLRGGLGVSVRRYTTMGVHSQTAVCSMRGRGMSGREQHTPTDTKIQTHMQIQTDTEVQTHMQTDTEKPIYTGIQRHRNTHTQIDTHRHTQTEIQTHTLIHIDKHTLPVSVTLYPLNTKPGGRGEDVEGVAWV